MVGAGLSFMRAASACWLTLYFLAPQRHAKNPLLKECPQKRILFPENLFVFHGIKGLSKACLSCASRAGASWRSASSREMNKIYAISINFIKYIKREWLLQYKKRLVGRRKMSVRASLFQKLAALLHLCAAPPLHSPLFTLYSWYARPYPLSPIPYPKTTSSLFPLL